MSSGTYHGAGCVTVVSAPAAGGGVTIDVSDEGPGFPDPTPTIKVVVPDKDAEARSWTPVAAVGTLSVMSPSDDSAADAPEAHLRCFAGEKLGVTDGSCVLQV